MLSALFWITGGLVVVVGVLIVVLVLARPGKEDYLDFDF